MGRKWTPEQRAKFKKTMAAKRKEEKQAKGVEIPLDLIPAPRMQPIARKVQKIKSKPVEAQEAEALGELIANVWLALCRKNRGV